MEEVKVEDDVVVIPGSTDVLTKESLRLDKKTGYYVIDFILDGKRHRNRACATHAWHPEQALGHPTIGAPSQRPQIYKLSRILRNSPLPKIAILRIFSAQSGKFA